MTHSILIVEDEFIVSMEIEERVKDMGYRITGIADNGEEAIVLARQDHPDLILMDIRLRGEMDGITAAEEIRTRFHIPVIFLTAFSEDATLERAKQAQPYGYILKPFNNRELKSAIEIALYRHSAEEEIRRLNRLYDVLSQVNQAVVRIQSRDELLQTVCRLAVERGTVDMAWIDWINPETGRFSTIARFGTRSGLLDDRCRDRRQPEKPQGTVFVSNHCVPGDCPHAAGCMAVRMDLKSCGRFPLHFQGKFSGTLNLGSTSPGFFMEREVELLKEVALDISFALDKIAADDRREKAERDLSKSRAKFRSYIQYAPLGICVADRSGRYQEINPAAEAMFGYSEAELKKLSIPDIIAPESLEQGRKHFHTVIETGSAEGQYRLRRKDGSTFWASISAAKIDNDCFLAFCQDITRQRRAVEMQLESQEKLRLFIEHAPAALAMFDREMRYLHVSRRWIEDYHLENRDLKGLSHYEVFPELADHLKEIHQRALSGEVVQADNDRFERADGSVQWLRWEMRPWRNPAGEVGGILIFTEDITERKQIEQEKENAEAMLRQSQKMEAVGLLAGGIAHDFNNILSIIIGFTEMALDEAPETGTLHDDLKEVVSAGLRAKELVRQILTFSRRSEREQKPVDITFIVREAVNMLKAMTPATIEIRLKVTVSPNIRVMADPTEIHQVIMNLCTNAAHAMKATGGNLDIELKDIILGSDAPGIHPDLVPGAYIRLCVTDTGHGMTEAVSARIFDPFFTTKPQGEGTGMGLSVIHGIVKKCKGAITVDSAEGKGATFCVYFPGIAMENSPETIRSVQASARGKGCILFVDDETSLADLGRKMLEQMGYTVTTAKAGQEALNIITSNPYGFDLLITDYTMPRMTGLDLALAVKRIRPGIPVIICSGFNDRINEKNAVGFGIEAFVSKPFNKHDLLRAISHVLDKK